MRRGRPACLAQQLERVLRDERLAAGLIHGVRAQRLQRQPHSEGRPRVAPVVLRHASAVLAIVAGTSL